MASLNQTHDPEAKSWVNSANNDDSDFPLQNLPFGVFRLQGTNEAFRGGVAIGEQILDLAALCKCNLFEPKMQRILSAASQSTLNDFMAMGAAAWSSLRLALFKLLKKGSSVEQQVIDCLLPQTKAEFSLPCQVGDYTDFYTSMYHAQAVGALFRPDNPLLPNYHWIPIGYHGRASSIQISGQKFHRPKGQLKSDGEPSPYLGPSQKMDYELELAVYIGSGNDLGQSIPIESAEQHIFGIGLLNDWSARDIQAWEYQPLGPFLGKNFATTLSPWIVTLEALEPYRVPFLHTQGEQPLSYLTSEKNSLRGAIDIQLSCFLQTAKMTQPSHLSSSTFKHSHWTMAQMVTHHTINGCNLQPGDILGTGTQSGPSPEQAGSLLELSEGGNKAISMPNGELRTFLEDGDTVIMRAHCAQKGRVRIGFGEVKGTVLPCYKDG